jgi:WD40 repeat protein
MANQRPLTHRKTEQLLAIYRDLSIEEKDAVTEHLTTCQQCSAFAESSQQMDTILRKTNWQKPDPRLAANFYNTIEKDGRSWFQNFSHLSGQLAGIAVLLVIVFSTWLVLRSGPIQTPIESATVTAQPTTVVVDSPEIGTPLTPLYTLTQTVSIFALSPQGSYLATAENNYLKIWDALGGKCLHKIILDTAPLEAMAFTPNGVNLIGRDMNGQFHRWLAFNGSYQKSFVGPQSPLGTPFALGNNTLVVVTADNNLEIWPLVGSEPNHTLLLSGDPITAVSISADGQSVAAVTQDGSLIKWNDYNKTKEELDGAAETRGLVFTQDGRQFATYQDDAFQLWRDDTVQYHLTPQSTAFGPVDNVHFASQNQFLMVSYTGGFLEFWDVNTGQLVKTFHSNQAVQTAVGLTRSSFLYLTQNSQGLIQVWEKPEE